MKVTTDACLFGAWTADDIIRSGEGPRHLLDIGTGTGLLSLMVAQKNPGVFIDAIEINPEARRQAHQNILASPWHQQISSMEGDIRDFSTGKLYGGIICNPPFYENEPASVHPDRNVALHSSELTFDDLFRLIDRFLADNGTFYVLIPYKRKKEIEKIEHSHGFYVSERVYVRQSVHHDFFRIMIAGKKVKPPVTGQVEISIWDEKQQYTPAFVKYLRDYYLYL